MFNERYTDVYFVESCVIFHSLKTNLIYRNKLSVKDSIVECIKVFKDEVF